MKSASGIFDYCGLVPHNICHYKGAQYFKWGEMFQFPCNIFDSPSMLVLCVKKAWALSCDLISQDDFDLYGD